MGGCFAIVGPDQVGALEFLGNFKEILKPGVHVFMPGSNVRLKSTRIMENRVSVETKTSDNVFVQLKLSVMQEVFQEKAYEAIYKLTSPELQIESFVADVIRGHVPSMTLDKLFEAKHEIATEVKDRLTVGMQEYGFHIIQVLVIDIDPDAKVKQAMNEINENRRLRMAAQEKAEAEKIIIVKRAEAEKELAIMQAQADAESKFLQGEGVARSRKAILDGLTSSICGSGEELTTTQIQELLLVTQYLDMLEKMSQNSATTVFLPKSSGDFPAQIRQVLMEAHLSQG